MEQFNVTILGCSSAIPTKRHKPTSQIVDFRGNLFMIDCGEGTQSQIGKYNIKVRRLRRIFISHLHGDHCYGLPGLLSTLSLKGLAGTVTVYLPQGGVELFKPLIEKTVHDLSVEFVSYPYGKQVIYEDDSISVSTFPLKHRMPCCGFIFREKAGLRHINREMIDFYKIPTCYLRGIKEGEDFTLPTGEVIPNERLTLPPSPTRTYAYISDTLPLKAVAAEIEGADLLYHEATFEESGRERAKETCHTTAIDAGKIASLAKVKKLVIGHFSSRYQDEKNLLKEAKTQFSNTVLANEGLKIEIYPPP